jgi:uncharacterized membrane protein YhaH (DUF805 family)
MLFRASKRLNFADTGRCIQQKIIQFVKQSCIATHPINTKFALLALLVASTAISFIERRVHTLALAAYFSVLALVPTHTAVQSVLLHVNTSLVAAIWSWTCLHSTNSREFVACQIGYQVLLSQDATNPS